MESCQVVIVTPKLMISFDHDYMDGQIKHGLQYTL